MTAGQGLHFDRFGRSYHLRIRSAEDLERVLSLDDAFWVATSAPLSGLDSTSEFLAFVDADSNRRIRAEEVRAAIRWLLERLSDRDHLTEETDRVALAWIDVDRPEGQALAGAARYILARLGETESDAICVQNVHAFEQELHTRPINGDGVITPQAARDDAMARFISDAAECTGGTRDLTGRAGITEEQLDEFLEQARAYLRWVAQADLPQGVSATRVMPLGERTPAAYEAFRAVAQKVDGFFARCRVVRFDPSAARRMGIGASEVAPADLSSPSAIDAGLARAPLAEPNAEGLLALDDSVNPIYHDAIRTFARTTVWPILREAVPALTEDLWRRVTEVLSPYAEWVAAKEGGAVERLGRQRLAECLSGRYAARTRALLRADREVAVRLAEARELKRLLLYHKHLLSLANNFVSFPDLYTPGRRAAFEMGSLVMDGRWFNFAVRVEDVQEHAKVARSGGMYVFYAELTRTDVPEDMMVVALPATAGTLGNLGPGKRGVFYDRRGRHYDARIVHIIDNPISFHEALASPFVRLGRFVSGKIEAISGTAERALENRLDKVTEKVQVGVEQAVARQAPVAAGAEAARTSARRRDVLLGASVSVAALGSAFAYVSSRLVDLFGFMKTNPIQTTLAVLSVPLVVFVPTAIVAAIKLSRRDLSALLEGSGWAINARMRLDRHQRLQFTQRPRFPKGATGGPRSRRLRWVLILVLALSLAALLVWMGRDAV
ncbi:MAG: hypothetical protein GXY85_08430 [Candidatus Brocadiaceae bacterium]|nr:hypothetical protein [Candidatus Brocadiaceae bacterium]